LSILGSGCSTTSVRSGTRGRDSDLGLVLSALVLRTKVLKFLVHLRHLVRLVVVVLPGFKGLASAESEIHVLLILQTACVSGELGKELSLD
jgi:hypothetical protein